MHTYINNSVDLEQFAACLCSFFLPTLPLHNSVPVASSGIVLSPCVAKWNVVDIFYAWKCALHQQQPLVASAVQILLWKRQYSLKKRLPSKLCSHILSCLQNIFFVFSIWEMRNTTYWSSALSPNEIKGFDWPFAVLSPKPQREKARDKLFCVCPFRIEVAQSVSKSIGSVDWKRRHSLFFVFSSLNFSGDSSARGPLGWTITLH